MLQEGPYLPHFSRLCIFAMGKSFLINETIFELYDQLSCRLWYFRWSADVFSFRRLGTKITKTRFSPVHAVSKLVGWKKSRLKYSHSRNSGDLHGVYSEKLRTSFYFQSSSWTFMKYDHFFFCTRNQPCFHPKIAFCTIFRELVGTTQKSVTGCAHVQLLGTLRTTFSSKPDRVGKLLWSALFGQSAQVTRFNRRPLPGSFASVATHTNGWFTVSDARLKHFTCAFPTH